jgi:chromate transporter
MARLGDWAGQPGGDVLEESAGKDRDRDRGFDRGILPVMNQVNFKVWLSLLWMFLKVNILSPSGPASVGLLYKEAVSKGIMTEIQFVEAVGFSNVLPGSEALKLAMFVGFAAGGIPGVFSALVGAILPPTVMMLVVSAILERFQHADWVQGFVAGMSPAVAALIVVVAWELFRATSRKAVDRRAVLIALLSAGAFWLDLPSPLVLLGAGLLGVVLYSQRSHG